MWSLLPTFVRLNPKLKKLQFRTRTTYWLMAMLSLYRRGYFFKFFGKNGSFNAIRITFHTFSEPFERTKFLMFESQLKKSLTLRQVQNTFKILHFGVKFCDLAQVIEIKVLCFLQHF